jgi:hypothetical protein
MAGRWNEAQRRSIRHWRRILDSIGRRDAMAIVSELNELSALCEMAREDAGSDAERCRHCVVFASADDCTETRMDISAFVLNGELDQARAATLAVVERIQDASPLPLR